MDFGTRPTKKMCSVCRDWIEVMDEKVTCEKMLMHRKCFICAICDCPLQPGSCSRDDGLIYLQFMVSKNQPMWFCSAHMMLGSGEKFELLKKKYGAHQALKPNA
ncbi:hypothetical protein M3Y94_00062400 [Aphelenchoides besseyi]|nr:hypothetical protein M3Y94_00059700 [Aphelenchoides besseyi]KAI6212724.1 hypothetical protein M3Y94_00062400 [Aphelenchoides besseyi]KAI6237958.1 hypothetical protein M3Y95_00319900 [Aphelenchoides besseyi]